MAIDKSNRSPSPMSFRQNPNPNFSNSKNLMEKRGDDGVRTSANRSPFSKSSVVAHPSAWCSNSKTTPANSPSENGRRNSFSKVPMGFSRDINEHKENKKPNPNLKPIKGTKNFMSPTISAVSKVTPSPKKKALAERNEAVRTSASLSDGKFLFFASAGDDDLKGETENCELQKEFHKKEETRAFTCEAKKRVTFDDDVVVLSPEVTSGYDVDEPSEAKKRVTFDDDVVVLSPEVTSGYDVDEPSESLYVTEMIKPIDFDQNEEKETSFVSSVSSPIALLETDLCALPPYDPKSNYLSPYDPKTNYLVPRPQFLRYKPEKVSLYIKSLEDTLSSETSSDNDMESTVEEAESEEAPVQEGEFLGSHSSSSIIKLESSDESIQAHEEDEEEISVESNEEISVGSEIVKKPRFFRRWRMITWLLFGVVAVLSSMIISDAPPESVLSKVYQYNHEDFSGSLHRMKKWSTTYLPLMISSFRETDDEFAPSEFLNFSALICDANDHFAERGGKVEFLNEKGVLEEETKTMDSDSEDMAILQSGILPDQHVQYIEQTGQVELHYSGKSGEVQFIEQSGVPSYPEIESHPNLEVNHEEVEVQSNPESGQVELHYSEKSGEVQLIGQSAVPSYPEIESHPNLEANHEEVEVQSNPESEEADLLKPADDPELDSVAASQQQIYEIEVGLDPELEEPNSYNTNVESGEAEVPNFGAQGAVMFLVASLCVATAFGAFSISSKYIKKAGINSISTQQAELPSKLKKEDSFYGNPSHGSRLEAETCSPLEMNSYSYNKSEAGYESEAQSKEERKQPRRNYKRESFASSSSEYTRGSESYGSFTTYSVRPAKNGDEEVATPVRRSNRINKVQPPLQAARRAP